MTLEEAIRELNCSVLFHEREADKCARHGGTWYEGKANAHKVCAEENSQLAAWLEELKSYRETYGTADRPQGEWIVNIPEYESICSVCGAKETEFIYGTEMWYGLGESKFCPNCGYRMKGADDEKEGIQIAQRQNSGI